MVYFRIAPCHLGKLFQIYSCESKRGFPRHPRLSIFLRIAETVQLLGQSEIPLNGFLAQLIVFLYAAGTAVILHFFQIGGPYMPCHGLDVFLAVGTLCKIGTVCTDRAAAPVLPVTVPIRGGVMQELVVGTDIAVVVLIINILIL